VQGAASTVAGPQGVPGAQGAQGAQGSQGTQGTSAVIGGSANQVVYKDGSNVATGSANLTFNGTTLTGVSAAFTGSTLGALVSITQNGAGNALIVQDGDNPETTPFVIDAAGNVAIGATGPAAGDKLDVVGRVGVRSTSLGDGVRLAGNGSNVNLGRYITLTPTSLSASHTLTLPNVTGTVITSGNLTDITNVGTLGSGLTVTGTVAATAFTGSATAATTTTAATGVGYMGLPQNSGGLNYTLVSADAGKHIYSTATRTITIPGNTTGGSQVAFPIGTSIVFVNAGSTTVTLQMTATTTDTCILAVLGTSITGGGSRTLGAHGMATLLKITATSWLIIGNGLS
jgi:hypothetical protein